MCAGLGAAFLHTDFMHLAGSFLPWLALSFLLEVHFGAVRVGLMWVATTAGGAFVSAALGPPCSMVRLQGSSPGFPITQNRAKSPESVLQLLTVSACIQRRHDGTVIQHGGCKVLGVVPGQVAGSNGAMAGLVPLAAGHLALSWRQCALPWLQLAALVAAVSTHIIIGILQVGVPGLPFILNSSMPCSSTTQWTALAWTRA